MGWVEEMKSTNSNGGGLADASLVQDGGSGLCRKCLVGGAGSWGQWEDETRCDDGQTGIWATLAKHASTLSYCHPQPFIFPYE